jgi:3-hydroxyacyl-CoA dehydrogenase
MPDHPKEPIAVVGAGLIGRAWAIVFARAGHPVTLWDGIPGVVPDALTMIQERLHDLAQVGLAVDPEAAFARVRPVETLAEALAGAAYVQENLPESVETKQTIFAEMDALTPRETILASSTSAIPASAFTEELPGRERCLVAHPANPPYLIPMVELCGAPWTDPQVIDRARVLMASAGQAPVTVKREIRGFILNRIQGALLAEAFRLVQEGYVSPEDLDTTVSQGLGLRWSFLGPFETIDLNAPGGVGDYCERYGPFYAELRADPPSPEPWPAELVAELEAARRAAVPAEQRKEREAWRDRRLMALAAHKLGSEQWSVVSGQYGDGGANSAPSTTAPATPPLHPPHQTLTTDH